MAFPQLELGAQKALNTRQLLLPSLSFFPSKTDFPPRSSQVLAAVIFSTSGGLYAKVLVLTYPSGLTGTHFPFLRFPRQRGSLLAPSALSTWTPLCQQGQATLY